MDRKYVMTPNGIICFPTSFSHDDFKHFKPTSAGWIDFRIKDGKVVAECWGKSLTLGIVSHPDDSRKATFQLCK